MARDADDATPISSRRELVEWLEAGVKNSGSRLKIGTEHEKIGFQEAVTPIAHEIAFFHNWILLPIITAICLFVLGLLTYVIFRFNEKANPNPSPTTHHSVLEVAWTVTPVMILVVIAIPSFRLLTHQLTMPPAEVTMKVTGKQWYWTYTYPKDQGGGFEFDSMMIQAADLKPGDIRQLSVCADDVKMRRGHVTMELAALGVVLKRGDVLFLRWSPFQGNRAGDIAGKG